MAVIRYQHILIFLVLALLVSPVLAGTLYVGGSPELSGYLDGTNELAPGSETQLYLVVENAGLAENKYVQAGTNDRTDLPTTAKNLQVILLPGDAPLTVKSDSQITADLPGGKKTTLAFTVKVDHDAPSGNYSLPVILNYTYLASTDQNQVYTMRNYYQAENITITVPVVIRPVITIDVTNVTTEHIVAGSQGYLDMAILNTGSEDGKKAVVKLVRNGDSPITPADSSVFVGDFPAGGTVECRYKVDVNSSAGRQTYPVDVEVVYEDHEGNYVTSIPATIGVDVGKKIDFSIVSAPVTMYPGSKKTISVTYQNTGDAVVRSAQSRLSATDPFTSTNDIAYLGDLQPGQMATATYDIAVGRDATLKQYGLDSEIRYRDDIGNTYVSNTMKVPVNVANPTGIDAIITNPLYISIIVAAIIGIIYLFIHYRRKVPQ